MTTPETYRLSQSHSGPSRSWTDGRSLIDVPVIPLSKEILKSAAFYTASQSSGTAECAEFLEMLGIDIKEIWK